MFCRNDVARCCPTDEAEQFTEGYAAVAQTPVQVGLRTVLHDSTPTNTHDICGEKEK